MLRFLKGFFAKPTPPETLPVAPYKIEAPTTDWPVPRPSEPGPEPDPVVATAPAKKPRAPAKPKVAPADKPVAVKKPRAKKPKSE
jgi:hypothetical protein